MIHGEGKVLFPSWSNSDGEQSGNPCNGFYTTCIFEAENEISAEELAIEKIRSRWRTPEFDRLLESELHLRAERTIHIDTFQFYRAKIVNFLKLGWLLPTIPEKGHTFYTESEPR